MIPEVGIERKWPFTYIQTVNYDATFVFIQTFVFKQTSDIEQAELYTAVNRTGHAASSECQKKGEREGFQRGGDGQSTDGV